MLSRRKPIVALAVVTAALAAAVPAASASAAVSVDPTVCQLMVMPAGPFGPAAFPGAASLATTLANAGATVGCAAPAQQPAPAGP